MSDKMFRFNPADYAEQFARDGYVHIKQGVTPEFFEKMKAQIEESMKTKLMKQLGYSKGYQYDHDAEEGFSGQNYFPDGMPRQRFYNPPERGFERELVKRLDYWAKLRAKRQQTDG